MIKRLLTALTLGALVLAPSAALAQKKDPPGKKPPGESSSTEELNLPVGGNKTYPAGDVKNFSEGVPGIADVKVTDSGQFVITGQKPGSTTVLLLKKDGSQTTLVVNVYARSPEVVKRELAQLLEGKTGLNVRQIGSRFFIEGGVNTEPEAKQIGQIASLYQGQVESLVTVGGASVDRKFNVRIDFFFVQYDKRSSYGVGISYPTRIGGEFIQSNFTYDFLAGSTSTATASVVNQPLPGLDLAARKGWAKVMKQSTVIMQNGTEALFDSGGEQNYQQVTGLTAQIYKIPFGTNVIVLPRYDVASSDMDVKIQAEVADLTPAVTGTVLPGRATSKLTTNVHLKLGQSLVLSGIKTQAQQRSSTGLPLLSEIPILGVFFGSQSWVKEEVEGAVFIVPSVVEAVSRSTVDLVTVAMKQYEKYSGDIEEQNTYEKKPPINAPANAPPASSTP
jgi:pilus assembly protein CpaC